RGSSPRTPSASPDIYARSGGHIPPLRTRSRSDEQRDRILAHRRHEHVTDTGVQLEPHRHGELPERAREARRALDAARAADTVPAPHHVGGILVERADADEHVDGPQRDGVEGVTVIPTLEEADAVGVRALAR